MIIKSRPFIRVFLALTLVLNPLAYAAEPAKPTQPVRVGDIVPGGHLSPEGTEVRYQGQQDALGREKVYAGKGNDPAAGFREGVMESNGSVRWGLARSRFPGQNTYPNYPAVKGSPIPPNQSLVPAGPVTDIPTAGHSGMNVRSVEYLPEFSEANRPSRIARRIEWSKEKLEAWRRSLADTMTTARNSQGLKDLAQMSSDALTKINSEQPGNLSGKVIGYSAGFFLALGLVAAYKVMTEHPENPAAITEYLNQSVSAMGVATFLGFILGSWAYIKAVGPAPGGSSLKLLPWFGGFLLAGAAVSTPISAMGNHPDFVPCMRSFSKFFGKYDPKTDAGACDRLQEWTFASPSGKSLLNDTINAYVPFAASILTAGGVFVGLMQTSSFIVNRYALFQSLRSAALNVKNGGRVGNLVVTAGLIIVTMGAFMMAQTISDSVFNAEKKVREFLVADHGLFSNTYGDALKNSESNLFKEWMRVKANGWKDPNSWANVCYDPSRSYQMFYNCDAPDMLDMEGLLDRYASLQSSWRSLQLADTMAAYQQWTLKVGSFNSLIGASYSLYRKAIDQIQKTGNIDRDELKKSFKEEWPQVAALKGPNAWKHVSTPTMFDFILTSMACGPEIDGYNATGSWWESTRQFVNTVTRNTNPDQMIDNTRGFTANFYPPRITTPIAGTRDTICQQSPYQAMGSGLTNYIRDNLRSNAEAFDDWWSDKVTANIQDVQNSFLTEYYKMLSDNFKPALTRKDYRWCQPVAGASAKSPTLKYLTLITSTAESCGPEGTSRLSYGILSSTKDEMRIYMAMLIELYVSNLTRIGGQIKDENGFLKYPESITEVENLLITRANGFLMKYDEYLDQLTVTNPSARKDMSGVAEQVKLEFTAIRDIVYSGAPSLIPGPAKEITIGSLTTVLPPSLPYQLSWTKLLLDRIVKNMAEAEAYFKLATAMDHLRKEKIAKPVDDPG